MHRISTRQHLVPGLLDLAEEDLAPRERFDPWMLFTAAVLLAGLALLGWTFFLR